MSQAAALDTVRPIATPEGCELELRIAGPISRARAWFYDFLIRLAGWIVLYAATSQAEDMGQAFLTVSVFLLEWFYPILFEVYWRGQTPGKRACDLMVVHDDGRPVGWNAAFIRNTVRFVDFLPFFYAAGFISTLLSRDAKRLGDLAAGTLVVHASPGRPAPPAGGQEETGAEPPPVDLTVEEQQAVLDYLLRTPPLTRERALELAVIPTPLSGSLPPEQARKKLLRLGNFLLGRR